VLDYISQPLLIEFFDDLGQKHTYVPDFRVLRVNGAIKIHEVTIEKRMAKENLQERSLAGQNYCKTKGWKYILHTEKDLPSGTELTNLQALFGYKPQAYMGISPIKPPFAPPVNRKDLRCPPELAAHSRARTASPF
jgi:hypothetical protein